MFHRHHSNALPECSCGFLTPAASKWEVRLVWDSQISPYFVLSYSPNYNIRLISPRIIVIIFRELRSKYMRQQQTRRRKGGMVPRRRDLRDQTSFVNFGVLISKIDVKRAKSGNFSLVFTFETSFSCNFLSQLKCNKKYFFVTVLPSQQ